MNIAKANIIRETIDAITLWEKRVKVDAVTVEINQTQINIKVQWSLNDGNVSDSVEVNL